MKSISLIVLLLVVMLSTPISSTAEPIQLQSGRSIEGQVVRTNDTSITIRTKSGFQTYQFYELANPPMDIRLDVSPRSTSTLHHAVSVPMKSPSVDGKQGTSRSAPSVGDKEVRGFFLGFLLTIRAGEITWLLGSVLLLIQGFRTSVPWGLLILFTNLLGGIIFFVFHPLRGVVPLLIMLVGVVVFFMSPFWALWGAGVR